MQPRPELLLLDEPAAGIDFKDVQPFFDLIGDLNRRTGVTVLLVSHDLSMVSRLAHHVLCLQDGLIQCQGPPSEIVSGEVLTRTFGADMAVYVHPHHHDPSNQPPRRQERKERQRKPKRRAGTGRNGPFLYLCLSWRSWRLGG